jgi:hypothetical protein
LLAALEAARVGHVFALRCAADRCALLGFSTRRSALKHFDLLL